MKKIVLILLAGALLLSAVEWEIEQVTTGPDYWNDWPIIAVDGAGNVGIVYDELGEDYCALMFATNATGSWVSTEIVHDYAGWASFDFDSQSNPCVVFFDSEDWENFDIFLAVDTTGEFTVTQLTDDPKPRGTPVLRVDNNDYVQIIYPEHTMLDYDLLYYGWIDEEGFQTELVTDQLSAGYDLVVDQNNDLHVFFSNWDEDGVLWHAFRSMLSANPGWTLEDIYHTGSFWPVFDPNGTIDKKGAFHIAFNTMLNYSLRTNHISNRSGEWVTDSIVDPTGEPMGGEFPVIAVDPKNNPYIAHLWYDEESETPGIYLLSKDTNGWNQEEVFISDKDEITADDRRFFTIDAQGYGHITYAEWSYGEEDDTGYVYHAKTKEPFVPGVADSPVEITSFYLEMRGSTVRFSLPQTGPVRLVLYDASGRGVECIASETFPAGEHVVPINVSELAAGVYFIRIEAGRQSASVKFVLTR